VAVSELLASYLAHVEGYQLVGLAKDGQAALEQCLRLKPRVLVLDIDLPVMTGLEVARRLVEAGSPTQIVVFTSNTDAATLRRTMETGVKGIVEKPASLNVLLQAIASVAQGRAFFGPAIIQVMQQAFANRVATSTPDQLTARERQVLQLIAEGRSNKEVASALGISLKTAENHRHHIMTKLNARNGADLTREAFRLGLLHSRGTSQPSV